MEEFEKFIRNNREAFNTQKADKNKLWDAIKIEIENEPSSKIYFWNSSLFKVAATVALIITLTFLGSITYFKANKAKLQVADNELIEIDMHYKKLVNAKIQELKIHPKLSELDKNEFLKFIEELDEEYKQLKLEMQKNLNNERILDAIIENYKKRIELLQKLKQQIENSKTENDYDGYVL